MLPPDPAPAPRCPTCGAARSPDSVRGHCPFCLVNMLESAGSDAPFPGTLPPPLREFGDYELLEEIARGGMGVVYRARQLSLGRVVAVKMILAGEFAQPAFVQRFRAEAAAAAALQHPNIVTVHEVGEYAGQHYFSMEYVEGRDLAELVRQQPLPPATAARYLHTIAAAIHFAHQHGILHRDLKPSNILIDPFDQPRITDFGLARKLSGDSDLTLSGQTLGSPSYMAPEQVIGTSRKPGPESDLYSLGAVLYHLLTGRPPFQADSLSAVLLQVRETDPVPPRLLNPAIPRDLETICLKCLEKDPDRRYRSAHDLAEELNRFLHHQPIHARPIGFAERAIRTCRRHPALSALSLGLALALVAGFAGVVSQWRRAEHHHHALELSERVTRLNLYAADVAGASLAVQRGDLGLARRLLDAHRPAPGEEDLRGFEWRFLEERCRGRHLATLEGHRWIVTCAAFSPDGRYLATGSQDRSVKIWEMPRLTLLTNLPASTGAVWSVAFTADGTRLLSSGSDNLAKLWDTTTWQVAAQWAGQLSSLAPTAGLVAVSEGSPFAWEPAGPVSVLELPSGRKRLELPGNGRAVALSPDGDRIAVARPEGGVALWNAVSGEHLHDLPAATAFWSLAFSPDGRQLVGTAYLKPDVYVWSLDRTGEPQRLFGHSRTVWQAAFSPDGRTLVTTGTDRTVRLWSTADWTQTALLQGHQNEVWCAAFSPDQRTFATGGKDGLVLLWAREQPAPLPAIANDPYFRPLFSPDGQRLLITTTTNGVPNALLLDADTRQVLQIAGAEFPLGFDAGGQALARLDAASARLEFWIPPAREAVRVVDLHLLPSDLPFARAGFSGGGRFFFGIGPDGKAQVWDLNQGTASRSFATLSPPLRSAVLSPDGRSLAVSAERMDAQGLWGTSLFEVGTGRESLLNAHRDHVTGQAFSPDNRLLATASVDGSIKLWDVTTRRELATLTGHLQEATDVAFSPDGRTLASVEQLNGFRLWHLATRRELVSWPLPHAGLFLEFSPDGRHLAVNTADDHHGSVELFSTR